MTRLPFIYFLYQRSFVAWDLARSVHSRDISGYLCVSVDVQSSDMTYLVEQLHLRASALVALFGQGWGSDCIDDAIVLDRPPRHPERSVTLILLALHLSGRYGQLGATRDLDEAVVLGRGALHLSPQGQLGISPRKWVNKPAES